MAPDWGGAATSRSLPERDYGFLISDPIVSSSFFVLILVFPTNTRPRTRNEKENENENDF
jgi:hypothetical protein